MYVFYIYMYIDKYSVYRIYVYLYIHIHIYAHTCICVCTTKTSTEIFKLEMQEVSWEAGDGSGRLKSRGLPSYPSTNTFPSPVLI